MIDSAARAERFELGATSSSWYTWQVNQKPVTVRMSMAVIDRLEREAVESFRSLTSRGSEIGGILLGGTTAGSPHIVTIEDYQSIDCDYARGPLYRLAESDIARFRAAIEKRAPDAHLPVGFFRSHTRKGLAFDVDDLAVMEELFPAAHQIALIIRPLAAKPSTAGIFIREDGKIRGESSYLEFPFRASMVQNGAPPAEAAPPKSATRAQIVPIASRREAVSEEAPAAPEPATAPAPVEAPVAEAPPPPAAEAPAPPPPPVVEAAVEPAVLPEPVKFGMAAPAESSLLKSKALLGGLSAAAVLLLVMVLFVYPGVMRQKKVTPPPPQDTSPLALRIERTGNDILLTWNRDSAAVRNAAQAVLVISDGPQQENVKLDSAQIQSGRIVYSPGSSDVTFRMEVAGQNGAAVASESLRVLGTRPSPFPDGKGAAPTAETKTADPPAPAAEEPAVEEAQPPERKRAQAVRSFNAESLSQRLRPARSTDLPDAPVLTRTESGPSASLSALNLGSATLAPPPQAQPPVPASKAVAPSNVQQAELIHRVSPEYPKMARDAGVKGTVELRANVGVDGKIRNVQVIRGPSLLQRPAADAVRQWVYRPTMLNGKPVESETIITLKFGVN